jgi:hypothetical protein
LLDGFPGVRRETELSHTINNKVEPSTGISFQAAVPRPVKPPLSEEERAYQKRSDRLLQLCLRNIELAYEREESWKKALRDLEAGEDHL